MKALVSMSFKTSLMIAEKHFRATGVKSVWLDKDGEEVYIVNSMHNARAILFTSVYVGDGFKDRDDWVDIMDMLTRCGAKLFEITT